MGQMLTKFLPNREKPDIRPMTTRVMPLSTSLEKVSTQREMAVTRAELTRAAPMPATMT